MKGFLFSCALLAGSLLVGDAIVGIYLLKFPYQPAVWRGLPVEKMHVVGHPYRAYMLTPGQRFWNAEPDTVMVPGSKPVNFTYTQDGVLVDDFGHLVIPGALGLDRRAKAPSERRILFLGNSTTFQAWPFMVSDFLNRADGAHKYTAIDAGTGGYTTQENLIDLQISGFVYKPDMVVAYLPAADVYNASHWPHFKRDYTHFRIPLEPFAETGAPRPVYNPHRYPFTWKLVDTLRYKSAFAKYAEASSLSYYTNRHPDPYTTGHMLDEDDYRQTIDAVIENVAAMKLLCDAAHIPFVVVAQKFTSTENAYYKLLNDHTLDLIEHMKHARRLDGLHLLDLQTQMPDTFTADARALVQRSFPGKTFDFDQPIAYDGMHLNPTGLYLLASIVADHLRPMLAATN